MVKDAAWVRHQFALARVARLATADPEGRPHLVPLVFALTRHKIYSVVDSKPKSSTNLKRLRNIAERPSVSVLVDHYDDDDWTRLWWARADGNAQILDVTSPEASAAVGELTARYRQYRDEPPAGPVIAISVTRWSGWTAAEI
jgi:PPOX class probable F420-dependent enzyme